MKNILASFLLCFLFLNILEGKDEGVEIRLTSPKLVEIEPGRIVTASFCVSNHTVREEAFFEKLELPADWPVIVSSELPFTLQAKEQSVRIVAFSVPIGYPAGRYQITYSVRSQSDYGMTERDSFSVVVLPVVKLEALVEDSPETVIAGNMYKVRLRLVNKGNSRTNTKLKITGIPDYPVKIEPAEMTLETGKSQILRLEVQTDEKLKNRIEQALKIQVEAEASQNDVFSVEQTVLIDIIPRGIVDFDPYHRLPSQLKLMGTGANGDGGFQVEYSGSGRLDEEGKRVLNFLFRGPDAQNIDMYGRRDEYRFSYYDAFLDLHVGDRTYSLSPLTEGYTYGRGAEVNVHHQKFRFGTFFLGSRWREPEERKLGADFQYQFNNKLGIKGNFLNQSEGSTFSFRDQNDQLYSIQSEIRPSEKINLDLEYSLSSSNRGGKFSDNAYRVELDGQFFNQIRYVFRKIHAGSKYFGYYKDIDYTTGTITFPIYHKLRGNFSYSNYKNNLDVDPTKATANRETSYRADISYSTAFGTSIAVSYEDFHRQDYFLRVDYQEKTVRLGLGQTLGNILSLYTAIEKGKSDDNLLSRRADGVDGYSLYAYFRPSRTQTYALYTRIGHNRLTESPELTKSAGVSATWHIQDNMDLQLDYMKIRSSADTPGRDNLFSTMTYTLPYSHSLRLTARWSKEKERKERKGEASSVFLTYTVPWQVPVSKKKNISILKGKVYDGEKEGRPLIPDVILRLDGTTAVTNRKGEFVFPPLMPGTYPLQVDGSTIGLNRVTLEKLPMMIEVRAGETTEMEINVVTSCRFSGKVAVFDYQHNNNDNHDNNQDSPSNNTLFLVGSGKGHHGNGNRNGNGFDKNDLREVGRLGNILVEMTNGKDTLREWTTENRGFSFNSIRPGKWTVKVHDDNLPAYHYLDKTEFQIELKPGEAKEITASVLPRLRPVQIIEEGEIKQENE